MRHYILAFIISCFFGTVFGQDELVINYESIQELISNKEGESYYPNLLKRFNEFDSTLTLKDYSLIYYGFSFQDDYLNNQPTETNLKEFLKTNDYEKIVSECLNILDKNPVSLLATNKMGYALFKLKKPEKEWKKYQNRYRAIRKVIVYSGNGLSAESAFKVIYVSDEYDILYDYFEISKIHNQSLVGMCGRFEVEPSEYYKLKEIYFDISRKLIRQQEIIDNK